MKKTLYIVVSALVAFSCGKAAPEGKYSSRAREAFENSWKCFRVHEYGLFSEYSIYSYTPDLTYFDDGVHQSQESSYLWPMSGMFSSAVLMARMDPERYMPYLDSMIVAEEQYYDTTRVPFAYQAYPARFDRVDRYYDDNGLVGIDYVDSWTVTKNPAHLEKAKQVFSFIISGWDDRFEGGVPWVEGKKDQKPACANGKALVLATKLHAATGDQYYLDTAKHFYRWIRKYLGNTEYNIIINSWLTAGEGTPQFDPYTYNTGTFIQAAAYLYKATGEQEYLDDALRFCKGSADYFFHYTGDGTPYTESIPWFDVVLFRGYQAVWEITGDTQYVDLFIKALDYAWDNARDANGLIGSDWTGKSGKNDPKWLLDASCIAEFMVRTAMIKGEIQL
ncbi:MAG: glycoside hydrolase family 76 protein [Candidatus Cryptobacteroides sp.]